MRATEKSFLQEHAYPNSTNLRARASIYDYRVPPGSLMDSVLDTVDWSDGTHVLDVGCGPGFYLDALRGRAGVHAVGVDLSPGMAGEARAHAPTAVADAATLPFPNATFDRVLAPHMLYHCPDIPAAVSELRRVLREDGVLVAVTNGAEHLKELRAIRAAVVPRAASVVSERFSLENGAAFLAAAFDDVQTLRFDGELRVPAVEPVSRYVASMMTWADDPDASSAMARIDAEVAAAIARDGVFRVRTLVGVFVCR